MNRFNKYMAMALSASMILQGGVPVALAVENTANTDTKTVQSSELEGKDRELAVGSERVEIKGLLESVSNSVTAQMQNTIQDKQADEGKTEGSQLESNSAADEKTEQTKYEASQNGEQHEQKEPNADVQKTGKDDVDIRKLSDEVDASVALTAETASKVIDTTKASNSNESSSQTVAKTEDNRMLGAARNAIDINETNFPDANFRDYVKTLQGADDNKFTPEEIEKIKVIDCKNKGISSLKGIEHFTAITELICSYNQLLDFDVSSNTKLQYLRCSNTGIEKIDVSKNAELLELECNGNSLGYLNLWSNKKLKVLRCQDGRMFDLDLSNNPDLEELYCMNSYPLTTLNLSANTKLRTLNCYSCNIHELDLSKNTELTFLNCQLNFLSHLDLSKNTKLVNFDGRGNNRYLKCVSSVSDLKGFEMNKVSNINAGDFGNGTVNIYSDRMTYDYKCNDNFTVEFGLIPVHSGNPMEGKEPTCTDDGWKGYYQCTCGRSFKEQGCQNEIYDFGEWEKGEGKIEKNGHSWTKPTYNWGVDNNSCTASRVCQNDGAHIEGANGIISQVQSKKPTCTENGETTYTATFKEDWAEKQTKTIENLNATGHAWDKPIYKWNINDKICTAKRVCKNDGAHIEAEDTKISGRLSKKPTCTEKGETTYTATFKESWTENQTKTFADINAIGHKWSEPVITFAEDGKTATATFTCQNDSSHVEKPNAVITSKVKIPATSEAMGITTYTATIDFKGKTYTATKDVQDIPVIKPEDTVANVVIENSLTEVPESLMNTEFNTVEKIDKVMSEVVLKDLGQGNYDGDVKTHLYDITLMIIENGVSRPATREEIEARGGITVVIPYPAGTNRIDYAFTVAHMLTMDMGGMGVGDIEIPDIAFTDEGLKVTLMGLSPVMVGYSKKISANEPSKPAEPNNPVEPNKPTEQTMPTEVTEGSANTGEQAPKTSDESKMILWVILSIASLGGVAMLAISRKSKKNNIG